ncbi:MAG TPA: hypothetical protein VJL84_02225 [Kiloniellales bacterium]|nr:hypothetical protein [Kiloniellales bacterium]
MARQLPPRDERQDRTQPKHKYGLGTIVRLIPGPLERGAAQGSYKIVALLPGDASEFSYRIKSTSEPHERVARESQLTR